MHQVGVSLHKVLCLQFCISASLVFLSFKFYISTYLIFKFLPICKVTRPQFSNKLWLLFVTFTNFLSPKSSGSARSIRFSYIFCFKVCRPKQTTQLLTESQELEKFRGQWCSTLTLRLLMSYIYIYGVPSKARNANIVHIWTYVRQRWNSLFLFAAQCFNTESMQRGFLCHICV